MLATLDSPNLAAYIIWVPRNGAREHHVEPALELVNDERATQYWDAHAAILEPYDEMFRLTGPCAGVFMVFNAGAAWQDSAPVPFYAEDAHARELNRELPQWDAERFSQKVAELLTR